jgi:two-component system C4-dicarboxylate transport sensor histidine kinase DctB
MQAVRKQIDCRDTKESFSLGQGILHVIQLLDYKAKKDRIRIAFTHNAATDIFYWGIPFKFQEIVINLLLNAIESYEDLPVNDFRDRLITITLAQQKNFIHLCVQDNSAGMSVEVASKIFEPFFTTKEKGKGIGIGLATIKKIIEEDLNGTIDVESKTKEGSLFIVDFPLTHEQNPKKR